MQGGKTLVGDCLRNRAGFLCGSPDKSGVPERFADISGFRTGRMRALAATPCGAGFRRLPNAGLPSRRARFLAGIRQAPDFPRGKVWADCAVLMRRKKTSLSNGLFLQRFARVSVPAFAGRLPAHWAARPPPKSLFSDARCLRRIRVWFCRTRRSPSSLCCLWRSSPSAFCRGTPRRPSSGRRSTTGSRRRP